MTVSSHLFESWTQLTCITHFHLRQEVMRDICLVFSYAMQATTRLVLGSRPDGITVFLFSGGRSFVWDYLNCSTPKFPAQTFAANGINHCVIVPQLLQSAKSS